MKKFSERQNQSFIHNHNYPKWRKRHWQLFAHFWSLNIYLTTSSHSWTYYGAKKCSDRSRLFRGPDRSDWAKFKALRWSASSENILLLILQKKYISRGTKNHLHALQKHESSRESIPFPRSKCDRQIYYPLEDIQRQIGRVNDTWKTLGQLEARRSSHVRLAKGF